MAATGVGSQWRNDAAGQEAVGAWLQGFRSVQLTGHFQSTLLVRKPVTRLEPLPSAEELIDQHLSFTLLVLRVI